MTNNYAGCGIVDGNWANLLYTLLLFCLGYSLRHCSRPCAGSLQPQHTFTGFLMFVSVRFHYR